MTTSREVRVSKPAPRWELYDCTTGKAADHFYIWKLSPFPSRKEARKAADNLNHKWGTNLGVREMKHG